MCLKSVLGTGQEVVPGMEEISLLREALKQLDQPFLVVIVGEFNSGKSTVINALLGTRFLAEGILPTTNEISVLKFRRGSVLSAWQCCRLTSRDRPMLWSCCFSSRCI